MERREHDNTGREFKEEWTEYRPSADPRLSRKQRQYPVLRPQHDETTNRHDAQTPASPPLASRKLFIGGLSWDTTDEGFYEFFRKYGEIEEAIVMRDKSSGSSRGFGFVVFKSDESAESVLKDRYLELDGRRVDPKYAIPKEQMNTRESFDSRRSQEYSMPVRRSSRYDTPAPLSQAAPTRSLKDDRRDHPRQQHGKRLGVKKIFVGALSADTTQEDLREYFGKFGEIVDAVVMYDGETGRSRGFGFVRFETTSAVDEVVANNNHRIRGKRVDCKKAYPKHQAEAESVSRHEYDEMAPPVPPRERNLGYDDYYRPPAREDYGRGRQNYGYYDSYAYPPNQMPRTDRYAQQQWSQYYDYRDSGMNGSGHYDPRERLQQSGAPPMRSSQSTAAYGSRERGTGNGYTQPQGQYSESYHYGPQRSYPNQYDRSSRTYHPYRY